MADGAVALRLRAPVSLAGAPASDPHP